MISVWSSRCVEPLSPPCLNVFYEWPPYVNIFLKSYPSCKKNNYYLFSSESLVNTFLKLLFSLIWFSLLNAQRKCHLCRPTKHFIHTWRRYGPWCTKSGLTLVNKLQLMQQNDLIQLFLFVLHISCIPSATSLDAWLHFECK
jgi:hypothetical protein